MFVNTARGALADERALFEAFRDGTILAAGLAVTVPEPQRVDNPLLGLPNCIVSHIASATVQTRDAMAEIPADNLLLGVA